MIKLYYIDKSGNVQGPLNLEELKTLHQSGVINLKTEVCEQGKTNWVPYDKFTKSAQGITHDPIPASKQMPSSNKKDKSEKTPAFTNGVMTKFQGNLIIALLLVAIGAPFGGNFKPIPKWEYTTDQVVANIPIENFLNKKHSYKTIPEFSSLLSLRGQNGWELVDTFLEHETSHPNFGKDDYVTGLQPNIRPQRLVLIFKRPLR